MRSLKQLAKPLGPARALVVGFIGLVTAVVGFAALLRGNFYAVAMIVSIMATATAFVLCCYVAFARTDSRLYGGQRQYKFGRYHVLGKLTAIVILGSAVAVMVRRESRDILVAGLFDSRTATFTRGQVAIAQLQVAESSTHLAVDLTIKNSLDHPVLIKRFIMKASYDGNVACCCPDSSTFLVNDQLKLERRGTRSALAGAVSAADQPEFAYPVSGYLFDDNCSSAVLALAFNAAQTVPSRGYLPIRISIPRVLNAQEKRSGDKLPKLAISSFQNVAVRCVLDGRNDIVEGRIGEASRRASEPIDDIDLSWP